jgi:hypothetical protein
MNIFVTYPCPIKSAKYLDNKRVVKMCLETAQMLSTAINELTNSQFAQYKSTHKNHPCNIWARKSFANWNWLVKHGLALCDEYQNRYNKEHKCKKVIEDIYWKTLPISNKIFNNFELTPFANCAKNQGLNIDFTIIKDVFTAYKLYLKARWKNDKLKPIFV